MPQPDDLAASSTNPLGRSDDQKRAGLHAAQHGRERRQERAAMTARKHAKDPATYTVDIDQLIDAISDAWHKANPGWNTGPARREIARLALDALPSHTMRLEDGTWTRAVGEYVHDCDMDTLTRVSEELMRAQTRA